MLDGHNRLLALKTLDGKIAGRALLRLVYEGGKPVLLLERIYPQTLGKCEKEALLRFAKERSKALEWPLYGEDFEGTKVETQLISNGGRGTWQYVDSVRGSCSEGRFKITNPTLLSQQFRKRQRSPSLTELQL
jgi:hypothetical protein